MTIQWRKNNDALGTMNRGVACESGLCTLCETDCKGKCETWLSSLRGRELLYPGTFGNATSGSGNVTTVGVGYHALRVQGYAFGANGLNGNQKDDVSDAVFMHVDTETSFGNEPPVRCHIPIMTGALGSTAVAARYWEPLAVGAAICGFPIVVGENVVGVDPKAEIKNGRTFAAPELDRRIETFLRYYDGHGAIIVQINVEDTRNGVAEYLAENYADQVILELKWGQGAKNIGGEIQVSSIEGARFLKDRGYSIDPDPYDEVAEAAFHQGALKSFARHSRLGAMDLATPEEVREVLLKAIESYRSLGFKGISLKTGAYGMEALAMALRYGADVGVDLLTIDGAGGGTGMSPWNMMEHWGIPALPLHAKTYEYARILDGRGIKVPDIALAGGFAREDHVFKALALAAPYAKLVCMGRAPMVPAFVGSNVEGVLRPDRRAAVNGRWDKLPGSVKSYGELPEEIFTGWEAVASKVGSREMRNIPIGAVAIYTYADKIRCGLQQFMAGARKFCLAEMSRDDLFAANHETASVTGIPYATEAQDGAAKEILET